MPGIGLPGCTLPWTFDACCISLRSGQLGIQCLLDFLVRTRAVSRHRSVQRPSTHLGGLPRLLFEVSSNASVCSRALLVDSRSACAAGHERHVQQRMCSSMRGQIYVHTATSCPLFFPSPRIYVLVISFLQAPFLPHAVVVCSNVFDQQDGHKTAGCVHA